MGKLVIRDLRLRQVAFRSKKAAVLGASNEHELICETQSLPEFHQHLQSYFLSPPR